MPGANSLARIEINAWALASFALYYALILAIGVYATRFSSTGVNEFFLGGRKMKRFVVALSAVVSGRSAWLILGVSGMAYTRGTSAIWAVVGYILVELFLFLFVAKPLRCYTETMDNITIPNFFESRFRDSSGMLRIVSAIIILVFMIAYVAAQFNAGGKAFHGSFGMDENWGILITVAIVFFYTVLGGFKAVSIIDMIQAICMILALMILPIIVIIKTGGMFTMLDTLALLNPQALDPFALSVGALIGFLGIGLGSPGNPHILARYMSIDDPRQLRVSAIIGTVWNVAMAWGAIYIGLVGRTIFQQKTLLPGADTEQLYPYLAQQFVHPIIFGLILASIFAAIMSTADSQLLVAASAIARDIYQKIIRRGREIPQVQLVRLSRLVIFVLVCVALVLAIMAKQLIFWLVLFAWGGLGASIGPVVILALFWKKTTKWGALAGLITGTVVIIVWNQTAILKSAMYELVPAFLLSLLMVICVSLVTQPKNARS
ncbi:sodium/proline symporter [candidate division KSB1 bacterium]|nr:sodium/proline symporter [candidate division KSB1 bacterium]